MKRKMNEVKFQIKNKSSAKIMAKGGGTMAEIQYSIEKTHPRKRTTRNMREMESIGREHQMTMSF